MTAATAPPKRKTRRPKPRSAYPRPMEDLVAEARQLVADTGALPSQNELGKRLHIGQPKAREVLAALTRPDLHLVSEQPPATPEPGTDAPTTGETEPAPADPDEPADSAPSGAPEPAPDTPPKPATAEPPAVPDEPPTPAPDTPPESATAPNPSPTTDAASPEVDTDTKPAPTPAVKGSRRRVPVWPVIPLTFPALVAIWSGWVSLGGMAGFGVVHPLPGIADEVKLNTAITLPIGVEVYAAYALWVWLSSGTPARARKFAKRSAISSLIVGGIGQVTYHLLAAQHVTHAPWPIVTAVACLPVAVLGMGAALAHLVRDHDEQ